jgi:hypothetical protein
LVKPLPVSRSIIMLGVVLFPVALLLVVLLPLIDRRKAPEGW